MTVYVGIDWARETHAIFAIDAKKKKLMQGAFSHDAAGFADLKSRLTQLGEPAEVHVGIETSHGAVVEFLLQEGFPVFVIHPNTMKGYRQTFGSAGGKSDKKDSEILAIVVQERESQMRPLLLDTLETRDLRRLVERRSQVQQRILTFLQQLSALLRDIFPAALTLFAELESDISLLFLEDFSTAEKARAATVAKLEAYLREHKYSGTRTAADIRATIEAAPPAVECSSETASFLVESSVEELRASLRCMEAVEKQIAKQLEAHADAELYLSLPRVGHVRAAQLIAAIGTNLGRFRDADGLAALGGLVPVTVQSGKHCVARFRYACNKELRWVLTGLADAARAEVPWAAAHYEQARSRGKTHQLAVRQLARRWCHIIFRMLTDRVPYDPNRERKHRPAAA